MPSANIVATASFFIDLRFLFWRSRHCPLPSSILLASRDQTISELRCENIAPGIPILVGISFLVQEQHRSYPHSACSRQCETIFIRTGGWPTLYPLGRLWVAHPCGSVFCKGGDFLFASRPFLPVSATGVYADCNPTDANSFFSSTYGAKIIRMEYYTINYLTN